MKPLIAALIILCVLPAAASAAACPHENELPSASPPGTYNYQTGYSYQKEATYCLIDRERAAHHLEPLRGKPLDKMLQQAAQEHTANQILFGYFGHVGPDGTPRERLERIGYIEASGTWLFGETLFWGSDAGARSTPHQAVAAWMASPGHREILLGPYTEVGVGIGLTPQGWEGESPGALYTADFGTLEGVATAAVTKPATAASKVD